MRSWPGDWLRLPGRRRVAAITSWARPIGWMSPPWRAWTSWSPRPSRSLRRAGPAPARACRARAIRWSRPHRHRFPSGSAASGDVSFIWPLRLSPSRFPSGPIPAPSIPSTTASPSIARPESPVAPTQCAVRRSSVRRSRLFAPRSPDGLSSHPCLSRPRSVAPFERRLLLETSRERAFSGRNDVPHGSIARFPFERSQSGDWILRGET